MLSIENRNCYSEVFELLKNTDRKDLEKIPMNLLETIKNNRNKDYTLKIRNNNIENTFTKKAISLYTWLYLEYIANNKEKEEINKILYDNEIKKQSNCKIDNNIFKKVLNNTKERQEYKETTQIAKHNVNFLNKIINKIKTFLRLEGRKNNEN